MAKGTVKWFNNQKGYGFVCEADKDEEIFAHFSSIVMEGYKSLKAGQEVLFEVSQGPKGLHALNIQPDENTMASKKLQQSEQIAG
jgi:CspA family cold shock protein